MRRAVGVILVIAIPAIIVAVVLSSAGSSKHQSTTGASDQYLTKIDHQDPNRAGCAPTAESVGGSTPVRDFIGRVAGRLLLRYSTACQAVWGRVEDLEGQKRFVVEVDLQRPADHAADRFHTLDSASFVFGSMLSTVPGCVYAEAWLIQSGRRGPTARTPCQNPNVSSESPGTTTSPSSSTRTAPTLAAQHKLKPRTEIADVRAGIVVYLDNRATSASAPNIPIGKRVIVVCKAPNYSGITSINYFYLLDTSPWRGLFASANQFANGAPVGVTTNAGEVDRKVQNCVGG